MKKMFFIVLVFIGMIHTSSFITALTSEPGTDRSGTEKQTEIIVRYDQAVQDDGARSKESGDIADATEEDDPFGSPDTDEPNMLPVPGIAKPELPQSSHYQLLLQKFGVTLITSGLMCADYLSDLWQWISSPCRKKKRIKKIG